MLVYFMIIWNILQPICYILRLLGNVVVIFPVLVEKSGNPGAALPLTAETIEQLLG
jgi:hypothetical protein